MKFNLLFTTIILLLLNFQIKAITTNVDPGTYISSYANANEGDTLLMASGIYSQSITFPTAKTITFKAAPEAAVKITFSVSGTTATNGGLIFEGVRISPATDYFISGDMGNITTLAFRNDTIAGINRCLVRTNTAGYTINNIIFDNCLIFNCGNGAWNFLYPKHIVSNISVRNCTLYNYLNGESFFFANNTASSSAVINFTFENNTVYKWAKSSDRALCNAGNKYSTASNFTFRNNIITEPGVAGTLPKPLSATGGNLTAENNLIINYGTYTQVSAVSQTINDLTLEGLGITAIGFPDPANGDFTILSTSPLATAGKNGGPIGDPQWIKVFNNPVQLNTSVSPSNAGTVSPVSATYESGNQVTINAVPGYGFRFKEWQDDSENVLSASNPYTFTITTNTNIKAVFSPVEMFTLTVNKDGDGAGWGRISLNPTVANNRYETGTIVDVTVIPNSATSFLYWEDATTSLSRQVQMDADKSITGTFDVVPFIVGWDFTPTSPTSSRPGDYFYASDNAGILKIHEKNGNTTSWGASTKNFGGITYNCARRYTDASNILHAPRYFEAKFSGVGYTSIRIISKIGADNSCVHTMQKMQYSTNGITFNDLVNVDVTTDYNANWTDCNATLPELHDSVKSNIYIRWIPDTTSSLIGAASGSEGFYLANIFVFADKTPVNDTQAPVLISSVPSEGSAAASAKGSIVLFFDEKVKAGSGNFVLNGINLTPVFGSKSATFSYRGLDYGTTYSFTIPSGAITDISGNAYSGTTLNFTTMVRPQPIARGYDAVVDINGSGDYTTVQAAIDGAPANRTSPWLIFIKNGVYEELVRIPANKPYMYFIGQDKNKVIITFAINCSSGPTDTGWEYNKGKYGMSDCATLVNLASNFYAENVSFENRYGVQFQSGPQALAYKSANDRYAFNNCKFRSFQDTWQTTTNAISDRHYAYNCWIEGAVDYVYGGGDVFIDNCTLYNVRSGAVIVAPSHQTGTKYGYVFNSCTVDGNKAAADGSQKLGRPWQGQPIAVYLNSVMNIPIAPEGWTNMGVIPKLFAEYNSMDKNGNPLDLSNRKTSYTTSGGVTVTGLKAVISQQEAAVYTYENVINGTDNWNPRAYYEPVAKPADLTANQNQLSWTASNYAICYVIFRDTVVVGFTTSTSYTDNTAIAGKIYTYSIKAANEYGSLSEPSDAVQTGLALSVKQLNTIRPKVFVLEGMLVIENMKPGSLVSLISINGTVIFKDKVAGSSLRKNFPYLTGVYVVKINGAAYKVFFNN